MNPSKRVSLPIDAHLPALIQSLGGARSLVLVAPPGAGKTTRLPPAIVSAGLCGSEHPNLIILQPRRVAARAVAQRIAEEQGWTLGQEVGYHVRFDRRLSELTRLRVLTEGILVRQLVDDPLLSGVGCVILDEFHERSLHTDMALALLKEVQSSLRPDLLLVVMSATLHAQPVARFLGDCPIHQVQGRTFPVDIEHQPSAGAGLETRSLPDRIVSIVQEELTRASGDVLVFLPGVDEIRRTQSALSALLDRHDLMILPLHGSLPPAEQIQAIQPSSRRKIVLATNIAETSLTIEGVRLVIDSGLARVARFDADRGLDRLDLERISRASADQRAGRAGRTAPGRCIRLWSLKEHHALEAFELPEIQRVDLAATVLALHAWGVADPRAFGWFQPPPASALASACRLLFLLGALDSAENGRITPRGRAIQSLPVHPRLARLLRAAHEQALTAPAAALAALLSEKDIVLPSSLPRRQREITSRGDSDLLNRLELLEEAAKARFDERLRDRGIDPLAARQAMRIRDELLRLAGRDSARSPAKIDTAHLRRLLLLAYPDRVCRRRATDPSAAAMVGGGGVRLAAESIVRDAELFLALDARSADRCQGRSESLVRLASALEPQWLSELLPELVQREKKVEFDPQRQRVVSTIVEYYLDLPLRQTADGQAAPEAMSAALAEALAPIARQRFEQDEQAGPILRRIALLQKQMPEHPWPDFDESRLTELLVEACRGKRAADEVRGEVLAEALRALLPYPLDRLLQEHAPEFIVVPSGSRIRLDYAAGGPPVLAVRLQELFGLTQTPRVAGGRVPVTLHLLGPNFRPVQITSDLASFWINTYPQVRKDLRARYPRHSWPDDPTIAPPQAKGGRRKF